MFSEKLIIRSTNYDVDVASTLRTQAGQSLHIISNILDDKAWRR